MSNFKKFLVGVILIGSLLIFTGCNTQLIDTTWKFDRATINMQDGTVISGKVDIWLDFENSDAVQIKIDGVTYYTHLTNVVLIDD